MVDFSAHQDMPLIEAYRQLAKAFRSGWRMSRHCPRNSE